MVAIEKNIVDWFRMFDSRLLKRFINGAPNYILAAMSTIVFTWIILPSYRLAFVETIAGLMVMVIISALAFFNRSIRKSIRRLFVIILGVCIITFIVPAGFDFSIGFLPIIEYSIFAFPAILALTLISKREKWLIILLVTLVSIMIAIVIKSTMQILIEYPSAARDLAQGIETPQLMEWRMENVGGFGFAYCIAAIGFLLLSLIMLKSNVFFKTAYIALFVYVSTFVFLAQYTTLLVFYTIGIVFLIFRRINNYAIKTVLLISTLCILLFLQDIMYELADYCNSNDFSALGHHFDDFGDTLGGKELRSSRKYIALRALNVWLDSPLWGVADCKIPTDNNYLSVMEAHSGVATILASTGLIGLALTGTYFYSLWKIVRNTLKEQDLSTLGLDISTLFMIIVFFINPIFSVPEISVTTFYLVPTITYIFNIKNGREK